MQELLGNQEDRVGSVERLRRELRGELVTPEDGGYDAARALYVSGFDYRPAGIARVADAADVARAVTIAREEGISLAVRGGGHSLAGHSGVNGGIMIDLSRIDAIDIDVGGRTAWAGGGVTAGEYTRAVGEYGLVTGFGDAPSVGVGGITLAGGIGFLHRAYGLTIDSLIAADVVTADGEILRVDSDTNPELFWAIRGGGGNFGVATRFKYRLHEVDEVLGGMLVLPATPRILHELIATAVAAPDELSGMINVGIAPPLPFFPSEVHGTPIIMCMLVYSGDLEAGRRALAPIRALATPLVDGIEPIRYARIYDAGEGPPHPVEIAMQPFFTDRFELWQAEAVLEALNRSTAPMSVVQFRALGGAVARVPVDGTAFPHRDRNYAATATAMFVRREDRSEHQAWARSLADQLRGDDGAAYVAFMTEDEPARVREAYGTETWGRLRAIKQRYDPENVFRRNHNVALG